MRDIGIRRAVLPAFALWALLGSQSCFPESPPLEWEPKGGAGGTGGSGGTPTQGGDGEGGEPDDIKTGECMPAHSSEALPARSAVISSDVVPTETEIWVSDLFRQFKVQCGACHVEANLGGFQMTSDGQFVGRMGQSVPANDFGAANFGDLSLARMRTEDPLLLMPPANAGGVPWSERTEGDPVRELVSTMELWIAAGRPPDRFIKQLAGEPQNRYLFSEELGTSLTNLGNCVPEDDFPFAFDRSDMDDLDALFAGLGAAPAGQGSLEERIGLPPRLEQTDLFTFDSEALARRGVIAFAPGYPLWSDGAGKLRHVRVPRGESIHYDSETREFEIPPNTRFYKTFLKKVLDSAGEERFRKIETRLIVARPDRVLEDGSRQPTALFGVYKWNQEETEATLITGAYRNGEPFRDDLFTYITDEREAQVVRDSNPLNLANALRSRGLTRHYAIPGKDRCIQCHMGSPSSSFVLGFTPLQVHRRPVGEGGVYDPSGEDELTQFNRLIALGVISGIESSDELVLLEDSQGDRKPRNDLELRAQGYMFGNCAHCHNPNGFPSVTAPELKPLLDFWPSPAGGIFQFPLERVSPRIARDPQSRTPVHYITPSIRELPPRFNFFSQAGYAWTPKVLAVEGSGLAVHLDAPWRSLIFRNVHTPFTYADDYAIFPHMPLNTPGYDCRAPQFLGSWMVSIPAKRKHPELNESFVPPPIIPSTDPTTDSSTFWRLTDLEPQPYIEVKPDEAGYDAAVTAAATRLERYQGSAHYAKCPDTEDVVDYEVLDNRTPSPRDKDPEYLEDISKPIFKDRVPDHPHWVETDLSDRRGDWEPRRSDWDKVFIDGVYPPARDAEAVAKQEQEKQVVAVLNTVRLSDVAGFADQPFPLGLWTSKPECNFGAVPKAGAYRGRDRPLWMDATTPPTPPLAPVYEVLPGNAFFQMICINCHGRNADGQSRLAETIQILSGGNTRVANFRDGLFNPIGTPKNVDRVFTERSGVSGTDWSARYLAWMALGGTQSFIHPAVLDTVARTDVLGAQRPTTLLTEKPTGNMLAAAQEACRWALGKGLRVLAVEQGRAFFRSPSLGTPFALITENGDSELWHETCGLKNRPVVRVVRFEIREGATSIANGRIGGFYDGSGYPADAPIGDLRGIAEGTGLRADNTFPWCLGRSSDAREMALIENYANANQAGTPPRPLPICPEVLGTSNSGSPNGLSEEDKERWADRGAINAGLSVFVFLERLGRGETRFVRHDECERLNP